MELFILCLAFIFVMIIWRDKREKREAKEKDDKCFEFDVDSIKDINNYNDYINAEPTIERKGLELVKWREEKLQYLKSESWNKKRLARLNMDNYTCQVCKYNNEIKDLPLHVHHLSYKNLYNENIKTDLITLCSEHHKALHEYIGYYSDDEMHEIPYEKIK